jgi:hypothetical protein
MKLFSHPSHRPWKSPQRFPHSHRRYDDGMNISQTFNVPGVGQNKMPKWAKPACQKHSCGAAVSGMLWWRLIRTSALPAYVSLPSRTVPAVCPRIPQTIDHKRAISDYPLKTARFWVVWFPDSRQTGEFVESWQGLRLFRTGSIRTPSGRRWLRLLGVWRLPHPEVQ